MIGIDPDTQCVGWARLWEPDRVDSVGVVSIEHYGLGGMQAAEMMCSKVRLVPGWSGQDRCVELPQVYPGGKARPNDLIILAAVSGACGGRFVLPRQWKGQQPKGVSQKAILRRLGWDFKDNGPKEPPTVLLPLPYEVIGWDTVPTHRVKEVVDAIGICQWALDNPE